MTCTTTSFLREDEQDEDDESVIEHTEIKEFVSATGINKSFFREGHIVEHDALHPSHAKTGAVLVLMASMKIILHHPTDQTADDSLEEGNRNTQCN
jgi:hypothetical protein